MRRKDLVAGQRSDDGFLSSLQDFDAVRGKGMILVEEFEHVVSGKGCASIFTFSKCLGPSSLLEFVPQRLLLANALASLL